MAEVRFYTDEHVSRAVVRGLRLRGIDVLTPPEAGMLGASDEAHLERARREGRVIYTQDSDFLVLDARGTPHAGIVYAPQGKPIREVLDWLILLHGVMEAEKMVGRVQYL